MHFDRREVMLYLTTVTPVYHGADTLRRLAEELRIVRDQLERESAPVQLAQAIFVDDGSTDGSDQVLRELRSEYPWIETITLSRNYGQHPATMAGILHASGDWVATLDEDLQHHPAHLLPMLQEAAMEVVEDVHVTVAAFVTAVHVSQVPESS